MPMRLALPLLLAAGAEAVVSRPEASVADLAPAPVEGRRFLPGTPSWSGRSNESRPSSTGRRNDPRARKATNRMKQVMKLAHYLLTGVLFVLLMIKHFSPSQIADITPCLQNGSIARNVSSYNLFSSNLDPSSSNLDPSSSNLDPSSSNLDPCPSDWHPFSSNLDPCPSNLDPLPASYIFSSHPYSIPDEKFSSSPQMVKLVVLHNTATQILTEKIQVLKNAPTKCRCQWVLKEGLLSADDVLRMEVGRINKDYSNTTGINMVLEHFRDQFNREKKVYEQTGDIEKISVFLRFADEKIEEITKKWEKDLKRLQHTEKEDLIQRLEGKSRKKRETNPKRYRGPKLHKRNENDEI